LQIFPVILCGGSGTRLWPASRPSRPKQFIPLVGPRSLFQETLARVAPLAGAGRPLIVAGPAHLPLIRRQVADLGVEAEILIEPAARDSAPAIAAAAAWIARRDPKAVVVTVASDHHIPDAQAFRDSVLTAAEAARQGWIVTLGVAPTEPTSAYGYIEVGDRLDPAPGVNRVAQFVEKPTRQVAETYLRRGFVWNSGNFVFAAETLLKEIEAHQPDLLPPVNAGLDTVVERDGATVMGEAFRDAPKISIDYAVMERTRSAAVARVGFAWSDLGAWDAVLAASARDVDGNAVAPGGHLLDCRNTLVRTAGVPIIGIGLDRVAIVADEDAILVCGLDDAQKVKQAAELVPAGPKAAFADLAAAQAGLAQWLRTSALPLWCTLGVDTEVGGFHESLDQAGQPVVASRRARVQARQVYVYATAGRLGWKGPWRAAVEQGLAFIEGRYRLPSGLYRTLVGPDGAPQDDTIRLYDQAFVIFALAAAARAEPDRRPALEAKAAAIVAALEAERRAGAGFTEVGGTTAYQSNPHMHLLEASLEWVEAGGAPAWRELAARLVGLCLASFLDKRTGALREYFDAAWTPVSGTVESVVEPGHQFEWSWLLRRWSRLNGGDAAALAAADRLFEIGQGGTGGGVAINGLTEDLAVADASARLWPQTEWLKAALARPASPESDAAAVSAANALWRYLETPAAGLWRDRLKPDGAFVDEPAPASSFYHIACAISELTAAR
jgi:mannose-1-phosphate guanylyltransferase/mannose-6-phosphate isomerase